MRNTIQIFAIAVLTTVGAYAFGAGINIFQFGASQASMDAIYTMSTNYTFTLMSDNGDAWFAQWLADEGFVGRTLDAGSTNFVIQTADTKRDEAIASAAVLITASNAVFAPAALLAAQAEVAADNLLWKAGDAATLIAAKAAAGATGVVVRAQSLGDAGTLVDDNKAPALAAASAAAKILIAASNAANVVAADIRTGNLIADNNAGAVATAIGVARAGAVSDAGTATGVAIGNHAAISASTAAAGHVRLGAGLITSGGVVSTLAGSHQAVNAAANLVWDAQKYTSFDIVTPLAADQTVVTVSNMVAGVAYTMTVKAPANADKAFLFKCWPDGNMCSVAESMSSLTIPKGYMLIVTLQSTGAGDYLYSTGPVKQPVE